MTDRGREANVIICLMAIDVILTELALQAARYTRLWFPILGAYPYPRPSPLKPIIYAIIPPIWLLAFSLASVYQIDYWVPLVEKLQRLMVGTALAGLILAGAVYMLFLYRVYIPRLLLVYFLFFDFLLLGGLRMVLDRLEGRRRSLLPRQRVLIVGTGTIGQELARLIRERAQLHLDVVGFLALDQPGPASPPMEYPLLGGKENFVDVVTAQAIDQIIFVPPLPSRDELAHLIRRVESLPVDIKIIPDVLDLSLYRARASNLFGLPIIDLRESAIAGSRRVLKRALDLAIAVPALIILSPLMALVAIAVKLDSPGPVIFKQVRVGENGRLFTMYKFRSMVHDAEARAQEVIVRDEEGNVIHKSPHDPRRTPLGRFLRRWSLDELPQLWNVIKGEMSLVGPRPELPWLVERYESWQRRRFAVPPGMTGWWQIHGRGAGLPMHMATQEDIFYVENFSIGLDIRILAMTIWTVLSGRGSY